MFVLVLDVGEVKQGDSLAHACAVVLLLGGVELPLGLVEAVDHEQVEFVVLISIILALAGFFQEEVSGLSTGVVRGEFELGDLELHDGLRHEDAHHEVELLLEDGGGFGVFVEDEGDPLVGGGLLLVGAGDVGAGEAEGFDVVLHGEG